MANIDKSYQIGVGEKFKQSSNTTLRQNAFSLEYYDIFYSLKDAQDYATSNPLSYVGQRISVVDENNNFSKLYIIQDKTGVLREVGENSTSLSPEVIEKSDKILEITEDGKLITTLGIKWNNQDLSIIGKDGKVIDNVTINTLPSVAKYSFEESSIILGWKINKDSEEIVQEIKIPLLPGIYDLGDFISLDKLSESSSKLDFWNNRNNIISKFSIEGVKGGVLINNSISSDECIQLMINNGLQYERSIKGKSISPWSEKDEVYVTNSSINGNLFFNLIPESSSQDIESAFDNINKQILDKCIKYGYLIKDSYDNSSIKISLSKDNNYIFSKLDEIDKEPIYRKLILEIDDSSNFKILECFNLNIITEEIIKSLLKKKADISYVEERLKTKLDIESLNWKES